MRVTRITTDAANESLFEEIDIPLRDAGEIGRLSEPLAARSVIFRETAADYDYDWHRAPQRQLVVLLDGAIEIEVGSGERRRFSGGDVLLVEDTMGRGHRTRSVDGQRRRSLFIPLDDSAEL